MSEYVRPEYTPLFRETQGIIADYLNSDPQISAKQIEFFPEAKLDIDFEVKKALGQQGIVGVVNTLKGTFAGHDGCTNAWQIEAEVDVIENPPVRRSQLKKMGLSTGTVSDILDWVQESLGGPSSPTFAKFNPVSQEIGQNNGLVVGRSIMRTLVLADTSAVISTENQWVCPYALRSELSALYEEVAEISGQIEDAVTEGEMSAYVASQLSGYLPFDGDGTANVFVNSLSALDAIYATKSIPQRLAIFRTGFNGIGQITQYSKTGNVEYNYDILNLPKTEDGQSKTIATREWAYGELSGKANANDLSSYLPISGGIMYGTIEFSPDSDWEHDLGYKLIQLNPTGEYWQALFGVEDGNGQPYVAHNGSETGSGEYHQYSWKLWFPDENGTLATREWTQGEISGKADLSRLSDYLPLSGGTLQGSIEIPAPYGLSVGAFQLQDKDFDGFQIGDSWDSWKFGGSSEQPNDVMRRTDISAFPTTDEISATRVETMTTIHESDWADISAQASSSTLYIVIPD